MQIQVVSLLYHHYTIRGPINYMKKVLLEIDRSARVATDLKRMLPLAFCSPELLCHAPIV